MFLGMSTAWYDWARCDEPLFDGGCGYECMFGPGVAPGKYVMQTSVVAVLLYSLFVSALLLLSMNWTCLCMYIYRAECPCAVVASSPGSPSSAQ